MSAPTTSHRKGTFLPPQNLDYLLNLSHFLDNNQEPAALVGPDGQRMPLPIEVYQILIHIVEAMQSNKAVTVAPIDQRLTTQEAADFLGISRPTLIKMVDQKKLSCETLEGSKHRRLILSDLLDYQERRRTERKAALQTLVDDAQTQQLYDISAEAFSQAIRAARSDIAKEHKR